MLHRLGLLQKAVGPALTYDSIDGLPVEVGLYTALVPMVLYAVMGTSRPLSVSTTSTIAMLTATELGRVAQSSDPLAALAVQMMLNGLQELGVITMTGGGH